MQNTISAASSDPGGHLIFQVTASSLFESASHDSSHIVSCSAL